MCCSGSTFKTQREAECHPKAEGQRWILPWDGHFFSSFCTLKFLSSSSENYCIRPSLWRAENLNNYPPGSPRGLQSHLCHFWLLAKQHHGTDVCSILETSAAQGGGSGASPGPADATKAQWGSAARYCSEKPRAREPARTKQWMASVFLRALNQTSGLKNFNLIPHNLHFLPLALVFWVLMVFLMSQGPIRGQTGQPDACKLLHSELPPVPMGDTPLRSDTAHIETSLRITPISPFHRRWTPLLLGNYGVHQHISFSECTWNKPKAGDDIRGERSRWGYLESGLTFRYCTQHRVSQMPSVIATLLVKMQTQLLMRTSLVERKM